MFLQAFLEREVVGWGAKDKLILFVNGSLAPLPVTQVEFAKNPQAILSNILIENKQS